MDRELNLLMVEKTPPLYIRIYETMRDAIVRGHFTAGAEMIETKLAEQMHVSRTPIRDALRQLAKDGLIVPRENGTYEVFTPTVIDISEVYICRASLEGLAAGMVAETMQEDLYKQLDAIIVRSQEANDSNDHATVVECNTEFHDTIVKSTQHSRLIQMNQTMHLQIMRIRQTSLKNPSNRQASINEHREILKVMRKGDSKAAEYLVKEHIINAGKRVVLERGVEGISSSILDYLLNYERK